MRYQQVCVEAVGYKLPDEVVTSEELERRLRPLYGRLGLAEGRLELISGIRQRRFWPGGALPSEQSAESGEQAIRAAGFDRRRIGALIHASVCRDTLEPATACKVHHRLGLGRRCMVYDVSNACLGMLNGMIQVANMIELRQIEAGLVVGTEGSRQLVETTIEALNNDPTLTRQTLKRSLASLTIGSASAAVLLCDREQSRTGNRLLSAFATADSAHHLLCHGGPDEAGPAMTPLMETDSEQLLNEGVSAGAEAFELFLDRIGWTRQQIDKTVCHQVGSVHRRRMFQSLRLDPSIDFTTMEILGNTGSVAVPITMGMAIDEGHFASGDRVAVLGIGSGINCLMIGIDWQGSCKALPRDSAAGPRSYRTTRETISGSK